MVRREWALAKSMTGKTNDRTDAKRLPMRLMRSMNLGIVSASRNAVIMTARVTAVHSKWPCESHPYALTRLGDARRWMARETTCWETV